MNSTLKIGSAGRSGEGIRSDARVIFSPAGEGLELELKSRVGLYFGAVIESQTRQVLSELGVADGKIMVDDEGALPFALAARIEAAVKAADVATTKRAPWGPGPELDTPPKRRLRRSRLYVPGNEAKMLINLGLYGADGVILDLEDSVHAQRKSEARLLVRNALRVVDFGGAERMVRINPLPLGLQDLEEIIPECPDVILIPKVESVEEIAEVDAAIDSIQQAHGIRRPLWLMPILETALGIERAFEIACCSERIVALTLGLEDLTSDLGVVKTSEGNETTWARQRVIIAARASGIDAIDSVFGDVGDREGLKSWGRAARAAGFCGMGCVHPRQIPVIHRAFAPSATEIDKAVKIVAAFEAAKAQGLGVVSLGSKMIDPPVVDRALKLVALAKAQGIACGTTETNDD